MPDFLASLLQAPVKLLNRNARPVVTGALKLLGVRDKIEVIRDKWGIPHIYASNHHDLFMAQGFIHAQERMWQMELNRRTAKGQLAAAFGEIALSTDRLMRTLGFSRLGKTDHEQAEAHTREVVQAYTAGVNAYLDRKKLPVEFTLTGIKPKPWTALDTFTFGRLMIFKLSNGWQSELVRAQLIEKLGPERAADLEIKFPERDPATLPEGIVFNRLGVDGMLSAERGPFLGKGLDGGGIGSNGWAIAGWRTTTGKPLLCNDMHLNLTTPGIWYMIHLNGGDYSATGVSLAGAPGILVGHNAHIAWGATLTISDVQDLFVEKIDPANPDRYEFKGAPRECEVYRESITVKGRAEPHIEEVRLTHHGPIIGGQVEGSHRPQQTLALASMSLRPAQTIGGFLALDRAKGWDDFVNAVRLITSPQLNLVYADTVGGNIGYWVTGTHPIRAKGQGLAPVPGWTGDYEWVGEIPFEEMPHALNPERGYIVTCNHRIVDEKYPHYLGAAWMNGYRAQRLVSEIERKGRLSPDDCRALQVDFHSIPGLELAAKLKGTAVTDPEAALALKLLLEWDGWLGADSVGGSVYQVTLWRLAEALFAPTLGLELMEKIRGGGGPNALLLPTTEFIGHATVTILEMLDDENCVWVKEAGGKQKVVEKSLAGAAQWLRQTLGDDPAGWQWGKLHQVTLPHPLGVRPPLDKIFNLGPHPIGGDTDTVCQTAFMPGKPYAANAWDRRTGKWWTWATSHALSTSPRPATPACWATRITMTSCHCG